jgi:hypothetical protein
LQFGELTGINKHFDVKGSDMFVNCIQFEEAKNFSLGLRPRKFHFWEYINGIFIAVCNKELEHCCSAVGMLNNLYFKFSLKTQTFQVPSDT